MTARRRRKRVKLCTKCGCKLNHKARKRKLCLPCLLQRDGELG